MTLVLGSVVLRVDRLTVWVLKWAVSDLVPPSAWPVTITCWMFDLVRRCVVSLTALLVLISSIEIADRLVQMCRVSWIVVKVIDIGPVLTWALACICPVIVKVPRNSCLSGLFSDLVVCVSRQVLPIRLRTRGLLRITELSLSVMWNRRWVVLLL